MTLEQLTDIEERLLGEPQIQLSNKEIKKLKGQVKENALDLHSRLGLFREILTKDRFNNRLNLGTDVESINWDAMPEDIANCFKPEFDYQPKEITDFYITTYDTNAGGLDIRLQLDRNDIWWSTISAGSVVQNMGNIIGGNYYSGDVFLHCYARHAQLKEAREAMDLLNESLWEKDQRHINSKNMYHSLESLQIAESILEFSTAEIRRQVDDNTS